MPSRRLLLGAALAAPFSVSALSVSARAETYPTKPIRVIVPAPAGGLIDVAARAISDVMLRELGQPLVIDTRPGGNGILGAQVFIAAPPDGYTLFFTVSGHVALPFVMPVPYDVIADFQPIAIVGISTALVCVPPQLPANTIAEFVDYARKNPGKLNYLNSGNGTGAHLLPELLKSKYGLDITSIYYKGLPAGVQDLLAGRVDLAMASTTVVMHHVKAGRLKALAVVGPQRLADLPNVATMAEQGVGDIEIRSSLPLYGQKDMPAPTVDRLNKAVGAAIADPDVRKRLETAYIQPLPMTPGEAAKALKEEHDRLGKLIRQLGIKADGGT